MDSRRDHVVVYDDGCGFCKLALRGLLSLDRNDRLRVVAIQSPEGERLLAAIPAELRLESAHLVTPGGKVISGGAAAEPLARLLPAGRIPTAIFARYPDRTDRAYRWIARHRGTIGRLGLRSPRWVPPPAD